MTGWPARAGAVVVTLAGAAALAALSAWPMPGDPAEHALLRLDWRLRGEEAGDCLRPRQEDLERLPLHMRNPDACLGAVPPYHLRLWVDDALVVDDVVRGGGAREDRPLTVYRAVPVTPGARRIRAEFVRDAETLAEEEEEDDDDDEKPPVALHVESEAMLEPGRVLLIVRRQDTGTLEVRSPLP